VLRNRHLGVRHGSRVAPVLALVNANAESPMESRMRMAMHLGGLPAPAVHYLVVTRGARYYLDLAYPEIRLATHLWRLTTAWASSRGARGAKSAITPSIPSRLVPDISPM